ILTILPYSLPILSHFLAAQLCGLRLDGSEDLLVGAAAADVSGEAFGDLNVGRLRDRGEERDGRHDEAARADAALETTVQPESPLNRVETCDAGSGRQAGDRRDLLSAAEPRRQYRAAVHRLAVDQHGTGAALRSVAPEIGVAEAELEVHGLPEALAVIDNDVAPDAIDSERHTAHRRGQRDRK